MSLKPKVERRRGLIPDPRLEFVRRRAEDEEAQASGRSFELRGQRLGVLVDSKQRQYGQSAQRSGGIMRILYPNGIRPDQYDDALLVVRVLDKLSRIAQRGTDGVDLGGESPWKDCGGYSLLGWAKDEST